MKRKEVPLTETSQSHCRAKQNFNFSPWTVKAIHGNWDRKSRAGVGWGGGGGGGQGMLDDVI